MAITKPLISGGILALTCGPVQFWTGLRLRAMNFHRWTGRLYRVVVGSTGAFLMGVFTTPKSFGVALMLMASAWILISGIALAAILRDKVSLHKEWMVRSYLTTFGFVTFRILNDNLPALAQRLGGSGGDNLANITWVSWLVPLGIYELILQSRRIFGTKQPPSIHLFSLTPKLFSVLSVFSVVKVFSPPLSLVSLPVSPHQLLKPPILT